MSETKLLDQQVGAILGLDAVPPPRAAPVGEDGALRDWKEARRREALILGAYRQTLIEQGFTPEQAFVLCEQRAAQLWKAAW